MNQFPKTAAHNATVVPSMRGMGASFAGRKGMPREWVMAMYADYLRLGSLAKVGKLHGRTRQNMWDIFTIRGLKLNSRNFQTVVEYKGRRYTCQKTGGRHRYLRDTKTGRRKSDKKTVYLHHVIWIEHHGPIPAGHKVAFKDGNHLIYDISNLELLTNSDQVKKYACKGHNQFTVVARERLDFLIKNFSTGEVTFAAELKST